MVPKFLFSRKGEIIWRHSQVTTSPVSSLPTCLCSKTSTNQRLAFPNRGCLESTRSKARQVLTSISCTHKCRRLSYEYLSLMEDSTICRIKIDQRSNSSQSWADWDPVSKCTSGLARERKASSSLSSLLDAWVRSSPSAFSNPTLSWVLTSLCSPTTTPWTQLTWAPISHPRWQLPTPATNFRAPFFIKRLLETKTSKLSRTGHLRAF